VLSGSEALNHLMTLASHGIRAHDDEQVSRRRRRSRCERTGGTFVRCGTAPLLKRDPSVFAAFGFVCCRVPRKPEVVVCSQRLAHRTNLGYDSGIERLQVPPPLLSRAVFCFVSFCFASLSKCCERGAAS
jgi:hypothetical protein